jgi:hypothetical protein
MSDQMPTGERGLRRWMLRAWMPRTGADWMKLVVPLGVVLIIVVLAIVLWRVLPREQFVERPPIATDIFEAALDQAIQNNDDEYELWYKSNFIIQCTLIVTALLATVLASTTTSQNADHVKKWSILLTALTAALATLQSTFHVRENLESFINSSADFTLLETEYLAARSPLINQPKFKRHHKDVDIEKLRELHLEFMPRYLDYLNNSRHAWANVGQQSLRPSGAEPSAAGGKRSAATSNDTPSASAARADNEQVRQNHK